MFRASYIPVYSGSRNQDAAQKEDMSIVFRGFSNYKNLDYVSCWFCLGAKYILNTNAQLAFVSTNSICQGEQVALTWPRILNDTIEIGFAHQSFKWTNNAKGNAGVTVIVLSLRNKSNKQKLIYINNIERKVNNINSYLIDGHDFYVERRNKSISNLPHMPKGNMPYDGGNLILSIEEKEKLIKNFPKTNKYLKRLFGAREFISNIEKWCLWIKNDNLKEALEIKEIDDRVKKVKQMRLSSSDESAHKLADRPHQFREINETTTNSVVIPLTTSERREYIPLGFVDESIILTNAVSVIYDAEPWIFGVIISKTHMVWMKNVSGRLKSDYRYSSALCYNTFPFPEITQKQKEIINLHVFAILEEREKYPEKTLAQLYDPDKMPKGLKEAHHELDLAIERCYRPHKPFESDSERLEYLFKMYEEMIGKNSLFQKEKKTK